MPSRSHAEPWWVESNASTMTLATRVSEAMRPSAVRLAVSPGRQGWFSLIAPRGPRPVCVTGKYSWTSFRQGPTGALIAHKGEKTDWLCDLRS